MTPKKIVVAGQVNSGKTSLILTLQRFLGINTLVVTHLNPDQERRQCKYHPAKAARELVNGKLFTTQGVDTYKIELSRMIKWQLADTTGLTEVVHPLAHIRSCMAMAIQAIQDSDCLIHVFDADWYSSHNACQVDLHLSMLSEDKLYLPIAAKTDSLRASAGIKKIEQMVNKELISCSAVTGQGFVMLRRQLLAQLKGT